MQGRVLDVKTGVRRCSYLGLVATVMATQTGMVSDLFMPQSFLHRNRSKYMPHQGQREMARRRRQMEKAHA